MKKSEKKINFQDYINQEHKWLLTQISGFSYCNVCQQLISGFFSKSCYECYKCGILAHNMCRKMHKNKIKCKFIIGSKETAFNPHQWVDGNLPINSVCCSCNLMCSSYYALEGTTCLWCQKVVHQGCRSKINDSCDFGSLKKLIITPNQIKIQKLSSSQQDKDKHFDNLVEQIRFDLPETNCPVVVVVNKKSGGQAGEKYMKQFYRYLNPIQVIDLLDEGLQKLKLFKSIKNLRVLACGGDGSISSLINFMKKEVDEWSQKNPSVGVLPLGTGNDLSRALGWGGAQPSCDTKSLLKQIYSSKVKVNLDRWNAEIDFPDQSKNLRYIMYNYSGIGIDAHICLKFHEIRERYPNLFKSRIGNKFIYGITGTNLALKKHHNSKKWTVFCEGKQIQLPECENLIVLNINYWGGGCYNVWGNKDNQKVEDTFSEASMSEAPRGSVNINLSNLTQQIFKNQSFNDGIIELIGFSNSLHLGQCQVGFSTPLRICQGKQIEIHVSGTKKQSIQIDGEPQEIQAPFIMKYSYLDQASLLGRQASPEILLYSQILDILQQAEDNNTINDNQKNILLEKFAFMLSSQKIIDER